MPTSIIQPGELKPTYYETQLLDLVFHHPESLKENFLCFLKMRYWEHNNTYSEDNVIDIYEAS